MTASFEHLFDAQAREYARYRPGYPDALFRYLRELAPSRRLVWDAGTGSGQAARRLAEDFERVRATDSSRTQISFAEPHPRIAYETAAADRSGLEPASCDLVTAASAVHWFDRPRFYAEVDRVLKPGGVIAVWCYRMPRIQGPFAEAIEDFYEKIEPYWPAPTRLVRDDYRDLEFPFAELPRPAFRLEASWPISGLLGYYSSWTAVRSYEESTGVDPVRRLWTALRERGLTESDQRRLYPFSVALCLRVGRKA